MFYWRGRLLFSPQRQDLEPDDAKERALTELAGIYEASANRQSRKKISDHQIIAFSGSKNVWLIRNPSDESIWVAKML